MRYKTSTIYIWFYIIMELGYVQSLVVYGIR